MSQISQQHSQGPSVAGAVVKPAQSDPRHSELSSQSDAASQGSCASRPGSPQLDQPKDHAAIMRNAAAELNMDTDQFYMYIYKVAPCLKNYTHDWSACPFAHKGEKATRRDPLKYSYMASNCPDHKRGACARGDSCHFAHGVFESCLHPERYRTQMCNSGTNCSRSVCFFAHTKAELRSPYCRNSPSQMDSTTATALRAMLGRDGHHQQQPQGMHGQAPPHNMMMQSGMSQMSRPSSHDMQQHSHGMHQQHQQQQQQQGFGNGMGAPQAGDILNQACNLLATIQMMAQQQQQQQQQGGCNDLMMAQQNLLKSLQASGALGGSMSNLNPSSLLSGLQNQQAGMDLSHYGLGAAESTLSMLLNNSGGQADLGLAEMRQPCALSNQNSGDFRAFNGGYNLPQQPFSYHLAS